ILQTSGENLLNLLAAADELELLNLAESVQEHLIKKYSLWLFSNLITSLNFTCHHNHYQKLYDHVLDIACRNPYSIFDSNDFPLLDIVTMICLLRRDDLGLEEIEIWNYLIKWGIANSQKLLDENVTKWSDEDISSWSDDQFMALKVTISQCIPLIRYYHISKRYIDEQIKQYRLDPNTFIKHKTFQRGCSRLLFDSFIFSFTDQSNPILSRVIVRKNDKAIWSDKYHGPCFGTFDLCMQSNHWTSECTDYYYKITDLYQFTVKEYEVLAFGDFNSRERETYNIIKVLSIGVLDVLATLGISIIGVLFLGLIMLGVLKVLGFFVESFFRDLIVGVD
ncbi:22192_t:CDS:2, partial [Racocetra persica]